MELMRGSFFADYFFACRPYARREICGRGGAPMAFIGENRLGANVKRGFCGSQSQAGLAIQPLVGLGFGWRWLGTGRDCIARFKYIAAILSALSRQIDSLCGRAMDVPAAPGVVNVLYIRRSFCKYVFAIGRKSAILRLGNLSAHSANSYDFFFTAPKSFPTSAANLGETAASYGWRRHQHRYGGVRFAGDLGMDWRTSIYV